MFLRKTKHTNGRIYLSICRSYWNPEKRKTLQKTVKSLGYLDKLSEQYEDPIAYFSEMAKAMTEEENKGKRMELVLGADELLDIDTDDLKNIGFSVLSKIYHELGIHRFFIHRERGMKAKYPLNNIMKLLVYDRILNPESKLATYENRRHYVENFEFSQDALYRSLKYFARHKDKLLLDLHENIQLRHPRDTTHVFYDVTNYYFHKDREDTLVRKGFSKDRRDKPIVQMGLLMDNNGIPMTYKLFRGNTSDFDTLLPILHEVKQSFRLERVIVVADKGLNSGTNKAYTLLKKDGYIFSRSLRGTRAGERERAYALEEKGYRHGGEGFKIKSEVRPTDIWVKKGHGQKVKVTIDEKHIVFYSEKYARRSRYARDKTIEKAIRLISMPSLYTSAEHYGALKYIRGMKEDKKTGELVPVKKEITPVLDEALIQEEEQLDGYYSIVTSELDMPDEEVIRHYKGLWRIEETFKISKSVIKARPVRVWTEESIEAHFLSCFLSLVLLRLLEKETGGKYSIERMVDSLAKANVCFLEMNKYRAVYYDEVLAHIDACMGTCLNRKYLTLEDIKKIVSDTK